MHYILVLTILWYQDTWRLAVDAFWPPYGPWQPRRAEVWGRRHHIWEDVGRAMPYRVAIIKGCCTGYCFRHDGGLLDACQWSCMPCNGSVEKSREEMKSRLNATSSEAKQVKQTTMFDQFLRPHEYGTYSNPSRWMIRERG